VKPKTTYLIAFNIALVAGTIVCLSALCGLGCNRRDTTAASDVLAIKTEQMLLKAGEVDKINEEAKVIFARFGTDKTWGIEGLDLRDFPTISALGNSVIIFARTPGCPAYISVRYGSHQHTKFIFIFDPNSTPEIINPPMGARLVQVASNIFRPNDLV
jgi:hypothetical protein